MSRPFLSSCLGALAVLALVASQASCRKSDQTKAADGYLLQIKPMSAPIAYHVKRQDRSLKAVQPEYVTNIDIEFDVSVDHRSGSTYDFKVSHFVGIDLDKSQTRHLARIAETIESEGFMREFDARGPIGELEFTNYNPAGWAGMMVAQALGRYEHGILGTRFPAEKLTIGANWTVPNDLAKMSKFNFSVTEDNPNPPYRNLKVDQTGGEAKFTLVKVENEGGVDVGQILFESSGEIATSYESDIFEGGKSLDKITEKGTMWVDMGTGWPIRGKVTRKVEVAWNGKSNIDESKTSFERQVAEPSK